LSINDDDNDDDGGGDDDDDDDDMKSLGLAIMHPSLIQNVCLQIMSVN
jgi:hypothetical protein